MPFGRFLASVMTGKTAHSRQLALWFEQILEGTKPTWVRGPFRSRSFVVGLPEFLPEFLHDEPTMEKPLRAWIAWAKTGSDDQPAA